MVRVGLRVSGFRYRLPFALLVVCTVGCGSDKGSGSLASEMVPEGTIETLHPEVGFVGVRDLAVAGGAIWVLDRAPPFLTRVSLTDRSVLRIGTEGQGPGEYRFPWAVQPTIEATLGAEVHIWDLGNGRVSTVSEDGAFLGSQPLDSSHGLRGRANIRELSYVDPFRIRRLGARYISGSYPAPVNGALDILKGTLKVADRRLGTGTELVRFRDQAHLSPAATPIWPSIPLWDACQDAVAIWEPGPSAVKWLDPTGRFILSVPAYVPTQRVGRAAILSYIRTRVEVESGPGSRTPGWLINGLEKRFSSVFPKESPSISDIRCQGPGVAWVRFFDSAGTPPGRSRTWKRVSNGAPDRTITFPQHFDPILFTDLWVIGLVMGRDGLEHLARWSVAGPALDTPSSIHPN